MRQRRTFGFSLVEIVVAALIIGSSALLVLELIRSSTVTLEVTEYEAAARTLAGDVMKRLAGQLLADADPLLLDPKTRKPTAFVNAPIPYKTLLQADKALGKSFPVTEVGKLLDLTDATVKIRVESPWTGDSASQTPDAQLYPQLYSAPISKTTTGIDLYRVVVHYMDPRDKREKEVSLVRLLARQ